MWAVACTVTSISGPESGVSVMTLPAMALMDPMCLAGVLPPLASEACGSLKGIARHAGISHGDAAVATLNANINKLLSAVFMFARAPSLIIYIPKPAGTGALQSFTLWVPGLLWIWLKNTAHLGGFDHMILAIKSPDGLISPQLTATLQHPRLGKLLFFDPTNELTPFGQIGGYLQANYGLLVTPDGGELVEVPRQPLAMNSIQRTAKLTLDATGTLRGDVKKVRVGDRAWSQRWTLRTTTKDSDRIKPIEELLAGSISTFQITQASVVNVAQTDLPFGFDYSFEASNYAKNAGNLLLLRPRVIGSKSSGLLETKEQRNFSIEFEGPAQDTDTFEIALPPGYEVDDLPPAVDVDFGFASYHSKTEVAGNAIRYKRTFEVKELSVPASKAEGLKKFYRIIASDERNTAVLKPASK